MGGRSTSFSEEARSKEEEEEEGGRRRRKEEGGKSGGKRCKGGEGIKGYLYFFQVLVSRAENVQDGGDTAWVL